MLTMLRLCNPLYVLKPGWQMTARSGVISFPINHCKLICLKWWHLYHSLIMFMIIWLLFWTLIGH